MQLGTDCLFIGEVYLDAHARFLRRFSSRFCLCRPLLTDNFGGLADLPIQLHDLLIELIFAHIDFVLRFV